MLRPEEFSLEGRAIRKVRQSVSRLQKAGYSFRVVAADDVSPELEEELADVSAAWRGDQPERGFSMTIDDLHVPGTVLAIASRCGRAHRRLPPPRAVAGRRRLVAQHDAPPAGFAERPDGVPHRRDGRVGEEPRARASCRSTSARSPTSSRPSGRRRSRSVSRGAFCSWPTTSSSSSGSTRSTGSSSRSGAAATSASSGTRTSPPSASRTSTPSRCSCRPARGRGAARRAGASPPNLSA